MTILGNRYVQIGIAILLGVLVYALPRPEGTIFEVTGDPERRLAAQQTEHFTVLTWEGGDGAYRLEADPGAADPGLFLSFEAAAMHGVEIGYVNGLSPRAFRFLAVLAALIFLFVVEPIPLEITALMIGVCLVGFDIVDLASAWATYMHRWWSSSCAA